jgi:hypothetical protein
VLPLFGELSVASCRDQSTSCCVLSAHNCWSVTRTVHSSPHWQTGNAASPNPSLPNQYSQMYVFYPPLNAGFKFVLFKSRIHVLSWLARVKSTGYARRLFISSCGMFERLNFEASCAFHNSTCMKPLRAHPRQFTCVCQLASCDLGFTSSSRISTARTMA